MKYFLYLLILALLCGINAGLSPLIGLKGQVPNLIFLLVLVFALEKDNYDFLFLAFFGGLFLDFLSGAFVGSFTLGLLLASFLLNFTVKHLFVLELNLKYLVALLLPSQLVLFLCFYAYNSAISKAGLGVSLVNWKYFLSNFTFSLIYNLVFLYPVYIFGKSIKSFFAKYLRREYKIR